MSKKVWVTPTVEELGIDATLGGFNKGFTETLISTIPAAADLFNYGTVPNPRGFTI